MQKPEAKSEALPVDLGEPSDDDIHVIPAWEDDEHVTIGHCPCEPIIDHEDHHTGKRLYVHQPREEAQ